MLNRICWFLLYLSETDRERRGRGRGSRGRWESEWGEWISRISEAICGASVICRCLRRPRRRAKMLGPSTSGLLRWGSLRWLPILHGCRALNLVSRETAVACSMWRERRYREGEGREATTQSEVCSFNQTFFEVLYGLIPKTQFFFSPQNFFILQFYP